MAGDFVLNESVAAPHFAVTGAAAGGNLTVVATVAGAAAAATMPLTGCRGLAGGLGAGPVGERGRDGGAGALLGSDWGEDAGRAPAAAAAVSLSFLVALLSFGTVLANALVIHVIRADRSLHTVSNCFAMSLAAADLLVGLLVVPFYALDVHVSQRWHEHVPAHSVWVTLDFLMTSSSILNLVLLNLDRFWSITSPMKYMRQRTKRRALALIGLVWGLALVFTIAPAAVWPYAFRGVAVPTKTRFVCFGSSAWLMAASAVGIYFVPLTLLCAIYSRIFRAIHRRHKMDLGRSSIASNMSNRFGGGGGGGGGSGGDGYQPGFISDQELQRLRRIYEKALCRERGERHLTAMGRKKKGYCPGAHVKRYESIDEEREGVNESAENDDPFASEANEESESDASQSRSCLAPQARTSAPVGVLGPSTDGPLHATRSADDIFGKVGRTTAAGPFDGMVVLPTIKVPRILTGMEASMDVIRERDGSWCSSKSNKSVASEGCRSRGGCGGDNLSAHSQEAAGSSPALPGGRKNSSPCLSLMSGSPKDRSPAGSSHRLSVGGGLSADALNPNYLQVLSPDAPAADAVQKRWSSPPVCVVDEVDSEREDDSDQTPENAVAAEENEAAAEEGGDEESEEDANADDDDDDGLDPIADMALNVKRKRADSGEGALARLRANSSEMIRRASPRLSRKEDQGDTESLLTAERQSSGPAEAFYHPTNHQHNLHGHGHHLRDSFQSNRLLNQKRQSARASYSLDLISAPRSDSGYASDFGFRRPTAGRGGAATSAAKKARRASLSFPIDGAAAVGTLRSRVRSSVSSSFSALSGRGTKALSLLKKQDKAARQLGFILACLLACWTPYFLQVLAYAFCSECGNVTAMTIAVFLGYAHSLCNPILFTLFNPRFQRACRRNLFPCRAREEHPRGCPVVPPSMI